MPKAEGNPKSEVRSPRPLHPLSVREAINPERRWLRGPTAEGAVFQGCDLWASEIGFRISFGLRHSGFGFHPPRSLPLEYRRTTVSRLPMKRRACLMGAWYNSKHLTA